jgi:17beta-estradiol 17-dehydrogenase / very-long-chain 3-oxoacyl-CoA reductase
MDFYGIIFCIIISWIVFKFLKFIYKNFIRQPVDLTKRYSRDKDSWVLVTGATDGIGKAFCEEFAKKGFNIILVSRTLEKLKNVENELKSQFPNIKTHVIEYDFSKKTRLEDYLETFTQVNDSYDICILVNNVGTNARGFFSDVDIKSYYDMISVNCISQTMLTKIFVGKMSNRGVRSAVIDLSSITSTIPLPFRSVYAATKSYNYFLTKSLADEYENTIDFLSLKPLFVSTALTKMKSDGIYVISATQCVQGTLRDLGYEKVTFGHFYHKIQAFILNLIPEFLIIRHFNKMRKNKGNIKRE